MDQAQKSFEVSELKNSTDFIEHLRRLGFDPHAINVVTMSAQTSLEDRDSALTEKFGPSYAKFTKSFFYSTDEDEIIFIAVGSAKRKAA